MIGAKPRTFVNIFPASLFAYILVHPHTSLRGWNRLLLNALQKQKFFIKWKKFYLRNILRSRDGFCSIFPVFSKYGSSGGSPHSRLPKLKKNMLSFPSPSRAQHSNFVLLGAEPCYVSKKGEIKCKWIIYSFYVRFCVKTRKFYCNMIPVPLSRNLQRSKWKRLLSERRNETFSVWPQIL